MILAVHTAVLLAAVLAAACLAVLALIVVAPWRRVRSEPPLPDDVEARLLLGHDPAEIADETDGEAREPDEAGESLADSVIELNPQRRTSA